MEFPVELIHPYYEECQFNETYHCDIFNPPHKCLNVLNSYKKWCVKEEECEITDNGLVADYD